MARFHRVLDPKTNVITVRQFTPEEEARTDAIEARISEPPVPSRLDLLEQRLEALEGKVQPSV
jgi:hypothetical protein